MYLIILYHAAYNEGNKKKNAVVAEVKERNGK